MPEQEKELQDIARRTKTMRELFPKLTQEEAQRIDKFASARVELLLNSILEIDEDLGVDSKVVIAITMMYAKSNIDAAFL